MAQSWPSSLRRRVSQPAPIPTLIRPAGCCSGQDRQEPARSGILSCFDPERQAVLLVAGDKQGNWSGWYKAAIPLAEERYNRWLEGEYDEERT